ncbi:MAG: 4Fe-4S dicluster domain-containing protein [Ignavibacteriales bacterium]|nr:4Fe-4S dicluster domain-containing protein [Ignavibacteriales bacterium]
MYKLKLNAKLCFSCGICMDVCLPRAIGMRTNKSSGVEGELLTYLHLHSNGEKELLPEKMMTFPYLENSRLCDGCNVCVDECPVSALEIQAGNHLSDEFFSSLKENYNHS